MSEPLIPIVYPVVLTLADTEYTQQLPIGTKGFRIQARNGSDVRFAFESGKVAVSVAPYGTLKATQAHESPEKLGWSWTSVSDPVPNLYFASATAGAMVEIVVWHDIRTIPDLIPDITSAQNILAFESNMFHGLDRSIQPSGNLAYMHLGKARLTDAKNKGTTREQQAASVIKLNGTADIISMGNQTAHQITGSVTLMCWVKTTSSVDAGIVGKWNGDNTQRSYLIYNDSGTVRYVVSDDNTFKTQYQANGSPIDDGAWHHVALVYDQDAGTVKGYLDGVLDGTASSAPASLQNSTANFRVGAFGNTDFLAGSVSDIRLYNAALTPQEITTAASWPDLYTVRTTNLQGHWDCTDQNGLILQDRSTNLKHGTITTVALATLRATDKTCPSADWPNVQGFTQARRFDGSSRISCGDAAPCDFGTGDFTVFFRVLFSDSGNRVIIAKDNWVGADNGLLVYSLSGTIRYWSGVASARSDVIINDGQWHTWAIKRVSNNLTIYQDGTPRAITGATTDTRTLSNSKALTLGASSDAINPFLGMAGEYRAYNVGKSDAQILAIHNGTDDTTNLVGKWLHKQEYTSASSTVIDESTNNNHGTPNGTSLARIPRKSGSTTNDIRNVAAQFTGQVPRSPIANSPVVTFNGTSEYANRNIGARSTNYPQTVRCSFRVGGSGTYNLFGVCDEDVSTRWWGLRVASNSIVIERSNTTLVSTATNIQAAINQWVDVVLRLDSATAFTVFVRLHGGGIRKYSFSGLTSVALSTATDAIILGARRITSPGFFWLGRGSQLTYFDGTAMSDAQAESLLDDPAAVSGAIVLARCVDGTGSETLADDSGNGNDLAITYSSLAAIWANTGPTDISLVNTNDTLVTGQDLDEDPEPNNYYANHLQTELADTAYTVGDDDEADVRFVRETSGASDRLIYMQPAATGSEKTALEDHTT